MLFGLLKIKSGSIALGMNGLAVCGGILRLPCRSFRKLHHQWRNENALKAELTGAMLAIEIAY